MDHREANIPVPYRINNPDTSSSSSSSSFSSSSSSPPDFLRNVQAAFKRHRPLGKMQSSSIGPRRTLLSQHDPSRSLGSNGGPSVETKKCIDVSQGLKVRDLTQKKNTPSVVGETQEDASITPPSFPGTISKKFDDTFNRYDADKVLPKAVTGCKESDATSLSLSHQHNEKKIQFSTTRNAGPQAADGHLTTGAENLTSHMDSLALTEMEWDMGNQGEVLAANHDPKHQFRNFLSQPVTQSSAVGSSCATTTSIQSTSAPRPNSTTYCSRSHIDRSSHTAGEPVEEFDVNPPPLNQGNLIRPSHPLLKDTGKEVVDHKSSAVPATATAKKESTENDLLKDQQGGARKGGDVQKELSLDHKYTGVEGYGGDITDGQSQASLSKNHSSAATLDPSNARQEKTASTKAASSVPRKRTYDPDLFFKVNGKFYQRLGKIGSGGSSEVYKVISSECKIYALKRIKLKGRDYATAFGFCQEIEYLSRLKGKGNIIQLIDYEVTDKALLREVMSGSFSNKDGRVKDDGYIYMVLEYGEIDLAHMLSHKWKELDSSNQTIDENWLRFYWQQILQAVNTIHEERIVHSDLKPANFLLVRGSLKLIDFGIAKAIMNDTTNIQRDSQVGTLSYMSPEAFMCNERDADGNTIKCGRPSDIWSLGCILYQMVYGRTPFAEYKTFWAKFKVITDPNHKIKYEPLSNPWLLDIMKKCLAWDRNERWRIPELLQHPFLVPPVPLPLPSEDQNCKLLQFIAEASANDPEASVLCSELRQLLREPVMSKSSQPLTTRKQCELLAQMSKLCGQLQERLTKSEY